MSSVDTSQRNFERTQSNNGYPSLTFHEEEILIVVKTSPIPSTTYRELVCTAGITKGGKWIRLFPIPFRYLDSEKWYTKYQRVLIGIEKQPPSTDKRIDSYRPNTDSIKFIGSKIDTKRNWEERKKIVLPTLIPHMEAMLDLYDKQAVSLGLIKPKRIIKFHIEEDKSSWGPKQLAVLRQLRFFDSPTKLLEKIPFKFSYEFVCDNAECKKGHKMQIFDWELTALYINLKRKTPYDIDTILEKIKDKWYYEMCGGNKDTYFIVGSMAHKRAFIILGVFWPSKPEGEYEPDKLADVLDIKLPVNAGVELLQSVNVLLRRNKGLTQVNLLLPSGGSFRRMNLEFKINPSREFLKNIKDLLGAEAL